MATVIERAFVAAGFKPLKPKKARPHKIQKCRKCGADMIFVEGTNVMVCGGDVEVKDENGLTKLVSCTNKFIFNK